MSTLSQIIVQLLGFIICGVCLLSLFYPYFLLKSIIKLLEQNWMMPLSAISRAFFGVAFILASDHSKWPLFFIIMGSLSILSGLLLPILGKNRILHLIGNIENRSTSLLRIGYIIGFGIGMAILYGNK